MKNIFGKYLLVVLIFVYLVYILLGGVFFHFLEQDNEERDTKEITKRRDTWLEDNSCVTDNELGDLTERVIDAYEQGLIDKRGNPKENDDESWSYHKSVYFATTLVTTIGYGNTAPVTNAGRVVVVIFACIGIPFALVVYGKVGIKLDSLFGRLVGKCFKDPKSRKAKIARSVINLVGGIVIFILLPSIGFARQEKWTYAEGCYYSFITLTTIGLGDFVAGFDDKQPKFYHLLISLWIIVGLAWMSSLVSNMYDIFNAKIDTLLKNDEESKGNEDDSDKNATDAEQNTRQNGSFEKTEAVESAHL